MAITRKYDGEGNYIEQNGNGKAKAVVVDGKRYNVQNLKTKKK